MPRRKRTRKEGKSISTSSIQDDDSENLQGGDTDRVKLMTWLEEFDMECNFVLLTDYKRI
jgi:hypothetical protein